VIVICIMLTASINTYEDLHLFEDRLVTWLLPKSSQFASGKCHYLDTEKYILFRAKILATISTKSTKHEPYLTMCTLGGRVSMKWDGLQIMADWMHTPDYNTSLQTTTAVDNLDSQLPAPFSEKNLKRICTNVDDEPSFSCDTSSNSLHKRSKMCNI
jgi:hypothetical protein